MAADDLISRSALLKKLMNRWRKDDFVQADKFYDMVANQNTAYDLEKRIEQLEERLKFYEKRFEEMSGTDRDVEDWGRIKAYKDAIEIVKSGTTATNRKNGA